MKMSRPTLLEQVPNGKPPTYWILDGRHRFAAGYAAGRTEFRCDELTPGGVRALRVLSVDELGLDPEIQIAETYKDSHARRLLASWNDRKCDPLLVVPVATPLTIAQRADLKLGADGARRRVEIVEHFLEAVKRGDTRECAIQAVLDETGWGIGFSGGQVVGGFRISSIRALLTIEGWGINELRRTLGLAVHWRGERGATSGDWLLALGLLIRDGYDEAFTPKTWERFSTLVPMVAMRRAQGLDSGTAARGIGVVKVHYLLAGLIRKHGGLRKRPARPAKGKGSTPQPIP
jgi:hypothetical protein